MSFFDNIWKNNKGFIWMLAVSIIILVSTQLTEDITWGGKFIVRAGFFLFTLIAIKSSSLSATGKSIGYVMASAILLLAIVMIRTETQELNLLYTILVTGYLIYSITLVVSQIFVSGIITIHKIAGGVAAYVLLGHIWATFILPSILLIQIHFGLVAS